MSKRIAITGEECALANRVARPSRGIRVGGGTHTEVPDDWESRIERGESVPGCSYYSPRNVGTRAAPSFVLDVDERLEVKISWPLSDADEPLAQAMRAKIGEVGGPPPGPLARMTTSRMQSPSWVSP